MSNKHKDLYFIVLPIIVFINLIIAWYNGDYLSPDSHDYIRISNDLPKIKDSLFPLFYPALLKITNIIINNYLITYKVINVFSILFCYVYTYKFKFFWKELWVILTFSSFQYNYIFAWSENIVLPLLIIFFHLNYLFYVNKINEKKYILKNILTLILLILTKYNSVFFVFPSIIISLMYIRSNKKFIYTFISCLGAMFFLAFYLFINYQLTGFITGDRARLVKLDFKIYLWQSIFGIMPAIEPFGSSLSKMKDFQRFIGIWQLPIVFTFSIFISVMIIIVKRSKCYVTKYNLFLLINSFSFLILTLISAYFTRIDILGPRLLLGFSLPLLLSIFVFIKANKINVSPFLLLSIALVSSLLHTITCIIYGF
ncbi:PMT_2 domain-containing protein [Chryseobacterium sp. IT-36CA2]